VFFRVPLLLTIVDAVIYRLDPVGTRAVDPPGPATEGYDDIFKEPVLYETTTHDSATRTSTRTELPPVRVPCQVEIFTQEQLRQMFTGNVPDTSMTLVTHRRDLELLGLVDLVTNRPSFGIGDRVSGLEKRNLPGVLARGFPAPGFFISELRPGSWGFGDVGNDLELLFLSEREQGPVRA
jgi:hypothetical protein